MATGSLGRVGDLSVGIDLDVAEFEAALNRTRSQTHALAVDITRDWDQAGGRMAGSLERAAAETRRSTGAMAGQFNTFSRQSRFALQNVSFQIQDIIVSLQAGQAPLRVFIQQGSQIAGAFGPIGAVVGVAVAAIGVLVGALTSVGRGGSDAAAGIDLMSQALARLNSVADESAVKAEKILESFLAASRQMRQVIQASTAAVLQEAQRAVGAAQEAFVGQVEALNRAVRVSTSGGDLTLEQATALRQLVDDFANARIGAEDFRRELEEFAAVAGDRTADALREVGASATASAQNVLKLTRELRETEQVARDLARIEQAGPVPNIPIPTRRPTETAARGAAVGATEQERQLDRVKQAIAGVELEMAKLVATSDEERILLEAISSAGLTFGVDALDNLRETNPELAEQVELLAELIRQQKQLEAAGARVPRPPKGGKPDVPEEGAPRNVGDISELLSVRLFLPDELADSSAEMDNLIAKADQFAASMAGAAASLLTGETSIEQFAASIIKTMIAMALQAAIAAALGVAMRTAYYDYSAAPTVAAAAATTLSGLTAIVAGRRRGGPVKRGEVYLVGEDRPELFVPDQNGRIIPDGRRAMNEMYSLTAEDRTVGRGSAARLAAAPFIQGVSIDARGSQAGVGAEIDRALTRFERRIGPLLAEREKRGLN